MPAIPGTCGKPKFSWHLWPFVSCAHHGKKQTNNTTASQSGACLKTFNNCLRVFVFRCLVLRSVLGPLYLFWRKACVELSFKSSHAANLAGFLRPSKPHCVQYLGWSSADWFLGDVDNHLPGYWNIAHNPNLVPV